MGRNEEGGILTQKLNLTIFAMAILLTAGIAGAIVVSDDASADDAVTYSVVLSEYKIATSKETTATLSYKEGATTSSYSLSWTAKLTNEAGTTQSSAVSKSSGSSSDQDFEEIITVTAPSTAAKYYLVVTYKETATIDGESVTREYTVNNTIDVKEPITLSVTVSNSGTVDVSNVPVYFYVDGVKIEDSKTVLNVAAGSSTTLTYKYFNKDLSSGKHTFSVLTSDGAYVEGLELNDAQSFYYNQSSQDYMTYIMIVIMIIVLIALVMVYRRPVKNRGKPKSRR